METMRVSAYNFRHPTCMVNWKTARTLDFNNLYTLLNGAILAILCGLPTQSYPMVIVVGKIKSVQYISTYRHASLLLGISFACSRKKFPISLRAFHPVN